MKKTISVSLFAFIAIVTSCSDSGNTLEEEVEISVNDETPVSTHDYNYVNPDLPDHFKTQEVLNADNGGNETNAGATLGRHLFYDKSLSLNQSISCASCHKQENAFSDPARFSRGFNGRLTQRNSMGLANARYYKRGHFFWDERALTLENQVLMPIQDEIEMGMSLDNVVTRLEQKEGYKPLIKEAYGDEIITSERISDALSQFVRSIVSYRSKYDEGRATVSNSRDPFPNFSALENTGKAVFFGRGRCINCHTTDLFIMDEPRNIGLDLSYRDNGLGKANGNPGDNGKFKASSLRNIALTAPYMHDGRFSSLRQVIDHYRNGIQNHQNLDRELRGRDGRAIRININRRDNDALIAFLETLTDQALLSDEKFSDPFENR